MRAKQNSGERGHALVELALLCPWIFFLFLAIFNFGIFAHAMISAANAARVAALYTSASKETAADSLFACFYAVEEMRSLQNVGPTATCDAAGTSAGGALKVQAKYLAAGPGDGAPASEVTVTYTTIPLLTIPFIRNQLTVTRTARMRI